MKLALFESSKKAIFLQFFDNLSSNIDVRLTCVLGIDRDIIEVNNNKNVELLGQGLIDVTQKAGKAWESLKNIIWYLK